MTSEEGVNLSPGLTRVKYNLPPPKKPTTNGKDFKKTNASKDDDYEELDDIDPAMALPARMLSKKHKLPSNDEDPSPPASTKSAKGRQIEDKRPSTESLSSEGFMTPPPVPPPRTHQSSIYDDDRKVDADADYDTLDPIHASGRQPLARNVSEMTDDEIEKLVNTPITLPQNDQPKVSMLSSARTQRVPALPSEMRSWKFKSAAELESDDDDNDFVNSTELQEMLLANQLDKPGVSSSEQKGKEDVDRSSVTPSPPPLPPREYTLSIMRKTGAGTTEDKIKLPVATVVGQLSKQTVIPPLHVRHVTGVGPGLLYSEHDIDGDGLDGGSTLPSGEGQRSASWLYSDEPDKPDGVNDKSNASEKDLTTSVNGGGNPLVNGSDDKPISTDEVEIQLPPNKQESKNQSSQSESSSPAVQPANGHHTDTVEIRGANVKMEEVERKESSSVDLEKRTHNGAAALSVPSTALQRASFTSSVVSDDVFNDSVMTAGAAGEGERLEGGEGEVHYSDNEDIMSERFESITTDIDLSMVTVEESLVRDGTVTPVQMTLNESVANILRYRATSTPGKENGTTGDEENELLESAEYSSLPEDDDGEEMDAGSKTSTRTDMTDVTYEALGRPRTKSWLAKTMELRKTPVRLM